MIETYNALGGEIAITDVLGRMVLKQSITMARQQIDLNPQTIGSGE